jgi:hypothetical protein
VDTLKRNTALTLQCCRKLVLGDEPVAPFAPQVFYPFFTPFLDSKNNVIEAEYQKSFKRSIEVLKLCDAVHFYTEKGLDEPQGMSPGQQEVKDIAEPLRLECIYEKLPEPDDTLHFAMPNVNGGRSAT